MKKVAVSTLLIATAITFSAMKTRAHTKKHTCRAIKTPKPPYLTLVGPVNQEKEGDLTVQLGELLSKQCKLGIIADQVDTQGVPASFLQILHQKKRPLGKVVLYTDPVEALETKSVEYLQGQPKEDQIRIAYSSLEQTTLPQEWILQWNLHFDLLAVPSIFLQEIYQKAGVTIPIVVVPYGLNLADFLGQPLKTERNPIFLFGHVGSDDVESNKALIQAFVKAFSHNEYAKKVSLHIHCPKRDLRIRQELLKEVLQYREMSISFSDGPLSRESYIQMFRSFDSYINLPGQEGGTTQVFEAMALGIPSITSDHTRQLMSCQEDLVMSIPTKSTESLISCKGLPIIGHVFQYKEQELVQAMQNMVKDYDQYLKLSAKIRVQAASHEKTNPNLQAIYKSLITPKRVLYGTKNELHGEYLQLCSRKLYEKYRQVALIRHPTPFFQPSSMPTRVINFLRPLSSPPKHSGLPGVDCIYVLNLDERQDRWSKVREQFEAQRLTPHRVSAINGWKLPLESRVQLMDGEAPLLREMSGGSIGCLLSHISIYKNAVENEFETVWICEDDVVFQEDAIKIPSLLKSLSAIDPDWDIFYTDYSTQGIGIQSPRPGQVPYKEISEVVSKDIMRTHGRYNTHSIIFSKKGLRKIYEYFSHRNLWSPIDVDIHYVPDLREYTSTYNIVTSLYDSSTLSKDGTSDTQHTSNLNH
ncbi:MAG: hypothetical protein FJZ58_03660 [Chlamydiae bacterium]|nr:hypothetical protein [Chlamydiota bacterium]